MVKKKIIWKFRERLLLQLTLKEIKEANFEQTTGTAKIPGGKIDIIYRDYKKGNKWVTDWFGFVKKGIDLDSFVKV